MYTIYNMHIVKGFVSKVCVAHYNTFQIASAAYFT